MRDPLGRALPSDGIPGTGVGRGERGHEWGMGCGESGERNFGGMMMATGSWKVEVGNGKGLVYRGNEGEGEEKFQRARGGEGGLRINGKGGSRGRLQAGGGKKVSSEYSWEGRNR